MNRAWVRAVFAAALLAGFVGASAWMQTLAWGVDDVGDATETAELR